MLRRSTSLFPCTACRQSLLKAFIDTTIPRNLPHTVGYRRQIKPCVKTLHVSSAFRSSPGSSQAGQDVGEAEEQTATGKPSESVPPFSSPTKRSEYGQEPDAAEGTRSGQDINASGGPNEDGFAEHPRPPEFLSERDGEIFKEEAELGETFERATRLEGRYASYSNPVQLKGESDEDFRARKQLFADILGVMQRNEASEAGTEEGIAEILDKAEAEEDPREQDADYQAAVEYLNYPTNAEEPDKSRTHPLTEAGRFSTFPSTIILPRRSIVDPVTRILSEVANKHLDEAAIKTFGGPHLPNSTATPSAKEGHLQQQPIALDASQHKMSPIEANIYLAAIMPGAYASVMSVLVETRKRLGSDWLQGLMNKPGGPRILDAGSAGSGVLAWQEVLKAEWERVHSSPPGEQVEALGKATVVTASPELRVRMSALLDNTTFLPRLPDFIPKQHLPSSEEHDPGLRKKYDVIIAPYTIWTLKEDYVRKAHIQNLWTLLNPDGGVLILIEKGVPRGFELVAGARDTLLKNHIASPSSEHIESNIHHPTLQRYIPKEEGMIIAPCTNHGTCPMYTKLGEMKARKDHCHFSQRFERPAYLQRLLGKSHHNHEDIRFSYLAVRRGVDARKTTNIAQDENATLAAFAGYETAAAAAAPSALTLPRTLLPPLKRHKHVVFDVCTPSARVERWTVSAAFGKQAYRDARKARWGDLWALGAKARVQRRVRDGMPKDMPSKRVIEVGVGKSEVGDTIRDVSAGYRGKSRGHGVRREQRMRRVSEKDFE